MKILTPEQMAAVDRAAQKKRKIPSLLLMEKAAEGISDLLLRKFPAARRVAVVCGPGHNGGDGLAVARLLAGRHLNPEIFLLKGGAASVADAATNLAAARELGLAVSELTDRGVRARFRQTLATADVIVDALFGTGLSRPLTGVARQAAADINATGGPVVAVDVPSGLSGETGEIPGECVRAAVTGTMAALKRCHVEFPARQMCGDIEVIDIGIPDDLLETPRHQYELVSRETVASLFPPRPANSHKGDFGHAVIVAGSRGKAGAALLAALGAMRAGAGMVTIAPPASLEPRFTAALPEAMTLPLPEADGALTPAALADLLRLATRCNAMVAGPGIGTAAATLPFLEALVVQSTLPAVFDADALNAFSERPGVFRKRKAATILTPHPGEAARLLGVSNRRIAADRLAAARQLARESGVIVILKGAGTITADPRGFAWHNPTGSPAMSTAGSGDVLAGVAGALLANGMNARDAAIAAAFIHGLAGELAESKLGGRGVLASDIAGAIPHAIRSLR